MSDYSGSPRSSRNHHHHNHYQQTDASPTPPTTPTGHNRDRGGKKFSASPSARSYVPPSANFHGPQTPGTHSHQMNAALNSMPTTDPKTRQYVRLLRSRGITGSVDRSSGGDGGGSSVERSPRPSLDYLFDGPCTEPRDSMRAALARLQMPPSPGPDGLGLVEPYPCGSAPPEGKARRRSLDDDRHVRMRRTLFNISCGSARKTPLKLAAALSPLSKNVGGFLSAGGASEGGGCPVGEPPPLLPEQGGGGNIAGDGVVSSTSSSPDSTIPCPASGFTDAVPDGKQHGDGGRTGGEMAAAKRGLPAEQPGQNVGCGTKQGSGGDAAAAAAADLAVPVSTGSGELVEGRPDLADLLEFPTLRTGALAPRKSNEKKATTPAKAGKTPEEEGDVVTNGSTSKPTQKGRLFDTADPTRGKGGGNSSSGKDMDGAAATLQQPAVSLSPSPSASVSSLSKATPPLLPATTIVTANVSMNMGGPASPKKAGASAWCQPLSLKLSTAGKVANKKPTPLGGGSAAKERGVAAGESKAASALRKETPTRDDGSSSAPVHATTTAAAATVGTPARKSTGTSEASPTAAKSFGKTPVPKKDAPSPPSCATGTASEATAKASAADIWKGVAAAPAAKGKVGATETVATAPAVVRANNNTERTVPAAKCVGRSNTIGGGGTVHGALDDSNFEWNRVSARLDQSMEASWGPAPATEFEHVFESPVASGTKKAVLEPEPAGAQAKEGVGSTAATAAAATLVPAMDVSAPLTPAPQIVIPSSSSQLQHLYEFSGVAVGGVSEGVEDFFWDHEPLSPGEVLRYDEEVQCRLGIVNASFDQGKISEELQEELRQKLLDGHFLEVRDVLHHCCHLNWAIPEPPLGHFVRDPAEMELSRSFHLKQALDRAAPAQTDTERTHKHDVLMSLSDLFQQWVQYQGLEQDMPEWAAEDLGGMLFASGSHKLQVGEADTDIDCVCVAPEHCSREAFFGSFCTMLESCPLTAAVRPLRDAYVPVIAFIFDGVHVDLLFCRLPRPVISPNLDIDDDAVLRGLASDPKSVRSLSTVRVSTLLLELVPQRVTYRACLRAVRTWAKRRGIYSQKVGFLGGIHWAILVGFICQHHPAAPPAVLLRQFFIFMTEWSWPQPVFMSTPFDAQLGLEQFAAETDRQLMPIITPGYPAVNSCVNVSAITKQILLEEVWRARVISEQVFKLDAATGSSTSSISAAWDELFQETDFFHRYQRYLVVEVKADSVVSLAAFCGFIESRLRKLCLSLSQIPVMTKVHPFPRPLHTCQTHAPHGMSAAAAASCVFPVATPGPKPASSPGCAEDVTTTTTSAPRCKICQYSGKMSTPSKRGSSKEAADAGHKCHSTAGGGDTESKGRRMSEAGAAASSGAGAKKHPSSGGGGGPAVATTPPRPPPLSYADIMKRKAGPTLPSAGNAKATGSTTNPKAPPPSAKMAAAAKGKSQAAAAVVVHSKNGGGSVKEKTAGGNAATSTSNGSGPGPVSPTVVPVPSGDAGVGSAPGARGEAKAAEALTARFYIGLDYGQGVMTDAGAHGAPSVVGGGAVAAQSSSRPNAKHAAQQQQTLHAASSGKEELDQEIWKAVRFFEATELLQYGARTEEMKVSFAPLWWHSLPPECVCGTRDEVEEERVACSRRWAALERSMIQDSMKYHMNLSQMLHSNFDQQRGTNHGQLQGSNMGQRRGKPTFRMKGKGYHNNSNSNHNHHNAHGGGGGHYHNHSSNYSHNQGGQHHGHNSNSSNNNSNYFHHQQQQHNQNLNRMAHQSKGTLGDQSAYHPRDNSRANQHQHQNAAYQQYGTKHPRPTKNGSGRGRGNNPRKHGQSHWNAAGGSHQHTSSWVVRDPKPKDQS